MLLYQMLKDGITPIYSLFTVHTTIKTTMSKSREYWGCFVHYIQHLFYYWFDYSI